MAPSLTIKQWVFVVLINIVVSILTTMIIIRVMMNQPATVTNTPSSSLSQSPGTSAPLVTPLPTAAAVTPVTVSANATVAPKPSPTSIPAATSTPARAATATSGSVNQTGVNVRISNVLYTGQRQREVVVVVNEGGDASMNGWSLMSSRNISYTFPNVTLFQDSFISIHTTTGSNVPTDLFMNRTDPVWQSGDVLTLTNQGQVIAKYTVK